jgi:hypothetical protein
MIQVILPFIAAITLSTIAGYYSVVGLALMFAGAYWPVVMMGATLEFSKVVTVSWLYNNWHTTGKLMKYYLLLAIIVLMLITSMGIFGYLSKAHIDTNISVGENKVQLDNLNGQEKIARDKLNYLLARAKDPSTASNRLDKQIQETQSDLNRIQKEKTPFLSEENKLMADVGPIRYIAEIFFDQNDAGFIDKAIRVVIFVIVFVFDPLAVLLLIASNQTLKRLREKPEEIVITKKKKRNKKDNVISGVSVESFTDDNEVIPKSDIVIFK